MIASLAPSRVKSTSEPVTTRVSPSSVRGDGLVALVGHRARRRRPTCRRWRGASRRVEPLDDRLRDRRADALGGRELSSEAARIASIEPNSVASARAAVGPTCRIDSATSTRHSGTSLASSRLASSRCAVGRELRPRPRPSSGARVNSGARQQLRPRRGRTRRPRRDHPGRRAARTPPRSPAPRCRRRRGRRRGRPARAPAPGRCWWLGQRRSLSPSFCSTSVVPQAGHSVGITHSRQPLGPQRQHRPEDLGDHVAGLAQDHGVAGADVLALHLVGVVQGGPLDGRARPPWSAPSRRTASPGRCGRCWSGSRGAWR